MRLSTLTSRTSDTQRPSIFNHFGEWKAFISQLLVGHKGHGQLQLSAISGLVALAVSELVCFGCISSSRPGLILEQSPLNKGIGSGFVSSKRKSLVMPLSAIQVSSASNSSFKSSEEASS